MYFLILTPLSPDTWVPLFGDQTEAKTWLAHSHHCVSVQTQVLFKFFFVDPLTNDGGPRFNLQEFPRSAPLWGPTSEDLAVLGVCVNPWEAMHHQCGSLSGAYWLSKALFSGCLHVCLVGLQPAECIDPDRDAIPNFFLLSGSPMAGVPGSMSKCPRLAPWGPAGEGLAVFRSCWAG